MSFNEKPGMYVFEKNTCSLFFFIDCDKKYMAFFSIWEYFCQKIGIQWEPWFENKNSQWKQGSVFDAGLDLLKAPKVESAPIYVGYKSDAYIGITHAIAANSNYCRNKVIY